LAQGALRQSGVAWVSRQAVDGLQRLPARPAVAAPKEASRGSPGGSGAAMSVDPAEVVVIVVAVCAALIVAPCLVFLQCWLCLTFSLRFNICAPLFIKRFVTAGIRCLKCKDNRPFTMSHLCGRIYMGAIPRTMEHLQELEAAGIKHIISVNLRSEVTARSKVLNKGVMEERGLRWLLVPTPDYNPPKLGDVRDALDWTMRGAGADLASDSGGDKDNCGGVFIHCNAGRGRSAVMAICLLMRLKGWSSKEAFDFVRSKRRISKMRPCKCGPRSAQWQSIVAFERSELAGKGANAPGHLAWQPDLKLDP